MKKKGKKLVYKEEVPDIEEPKTSKEAMSPMDKKEDSWEDKQMLDTLMEAESIKGDPAKMERVRKLAGRKMGHIKSIQDLKDVYEAKTANGDFKKKG